MKYLTSLLAALALLVAVAACSQDPSLTSGTVIEKKVVPERNWTDHWCVLYSNIGSIRVCTIWDSQERHEPAKFQVKVDGSVDGKSYQQWKTVDQDEWNAYTTGEEWPGGSMAVESTATTTGVTSYG